MDSLLVASLIMIVILALIALFTKHYAAFCYKLMVSDKLEIINSIMTTEEVPLKWRLKILENIVQKHPVLIFSNLITAFLKQWYILRLNRMLIYIKRSSLIKGQDKQEYISAFKEIEIDWAGGGTDIL